MGTRIDLLNHSQIMQKLKRMAYEVLEKTHNEKSLYIIGYGERGYIIAEHLNKLLQEISSFELILINGNIENGLKLNPEIKDFGKNPVLFVDDVLNSGKTLAEVLAALLKLNPGPIYSLFLAERNHRSYPVHGDVVGISLASTLQEHVYFDAKELNNLKVYLQ